MRHLIISSKTNQHFFWRNNVALDFFTAEITLAGLLRSQAQAPPYFFRKNEVPLPLFLKEQRCVSLFLQKKMRHLIISSGRNNEAPEVFTAPIALLVGLLWSQAQAPKHFFRKKWSTSLFLHKNWGTSLFLQIKMKLLIIHSEKNEAPHYFLRTKWSSS